MVILEPNVRFLSRTEAFQGPSVCYSVWRIDTIGYKCASAEGAIRNLGPLLIKKLATRLVTLDLGCQSFVLWEPFTAAKKNCGLQKIFELYDKVVVNYYITQIHILQNDPSKKLKFFKVAKIAKNGPGWDAGSALLL